MAGVNLFSHLTSILILLNTTPLPPIPSSTPLTLLSLCLSITVLYLFLILISIDGEAWATVVRSPLATTATDTLPYCTGYTGTTPPPSSYQLQCTVLDGADVSLPLSPVSSVFVTTAFYQRQDTRGCTPAQMQTGCSTPWNLGTTPSTQYVAGIEDYTVRIKHYAQATKHYLSTSFPSRYSVMSDNSAGKLLDDDNNVIQSFDSSGQTDDITLSTLLRAAGVSLDGQCVGTGCVDGTSQRTGGLVLFVTVEWTNLDNMEEPMHYLYRVKRLDNALYSREERIATGLDATTRTIVHRDGVNIIFAVTGSVGRFDFPLFLVYLSSTLVFFIAIGLFIDFLMLICMGNRRIYHQLIYETPIDPEKVEKKVKVLMESKDTKHVGIEACNKLGTMIVKEETDEIEIPLHKEILSSPIFNEVYANRRLLQLLTGQEDPHLQELTQEEIDSLFRAVGMGSKTLPFKDVKEALQYIEVPFNDSELEKIMIKFDPKNPKNPTVTKDQFGLIIKKYPITFISRARIMLKRRDANNKAGFNEDDQKKMIENEFEKLDSDGDRLVSALETSGYLQTKGYQLTPVQFAALFRRYDVDSDGKVDQTEFYRIWRVVQAAMEEQNERDEEQAESNIRQAIMGGKGGASSAPVAAAAPVVTSSSSSNGGSGGKNKLNMVNWGAIKSQFRTTTEHINQLHENYIELNRITKMLQVRLAPDTLEKQEEIDPVRLDGDWRGDTAEECKTT